MDAPTIKINYDRLDAAFPQAYFDYAPGCSEPGYDDKPVILANWNHVPNKTFDALERAGYSCEWSDEWIACDNCYKVFRASPDCYHWQMAGIICDGYALCLDCIDPYEYYPELENNHRKAVTINIADKYPPEDYGYKLVTEGYENGWRPGQNDNPESILKDALTQDPEGNYLFVMTDQGQFDIEFALYHRKDE